MYTAKQLIDALNEKEFMAFGQKGDSKRASISIAGSDGNRYWLTRVGIGVNDNGTAKYQWVVGTKMKTKEELAEERNGKNTQPDSEKL